MRKFGIMVLSLVLVLFGWLSGLENVTFTAAAFTGEAPVDSGYAISQSQIMRGARSNVNRTLQTANIDDDGLHIQGMVEKDKILTKVAVKSLTSVDSGFGMELKETVGVTGGSMDIGLVRGDVDEGWLDPWDFLGVDLNDAGTVGKFLSISGLTIRVPLSGTGNVSVFLKLNGTSVALAPFCIVDTSTLITAGADYTFGLEKCGENWTIKLQGKTLELVKITPMHPANANVTAQNALNQVCASFVESGAYPMIVLSGNGAEGMVKTTLSSVGNKKVVPLTPSDQWVGQIQRPVCSNEIEFSCIENYYLGFPEYKDCTFTHLSLPQTDPQFTIGEQGLTLSGQDKLSGLNANISCRNQFMALDGFTISANVQDMPTTTSSVNSTVSFTLSAKENVSYYWADSIHVRTFFPYSGAMFADVLIWGEPVDNVPKIVGELPLQAIPLAANGGVELAIREVSGEYFVYVNGVRFGDGFSAILRSVVDKLASGFYFSTSNVVEDARVGGAIKGTNSTSHVIYQIGGNKIVNHQPTMFKANAPYYPDREDITDTSISLQWSQEKPKIEDSNFVVDGYVIDVYDDAGKLLLTDKVVGAAMTTYTSVHLKADTLYHFEVFGVNQVSSDTPIRVVRYQKWQARTLKANAVPSGLAGGFISSNGFLMLGILLAELAICLLVKVGMTAHTLDDQKVKNCRMIKPKRTIQREPLMPFIRRTVALGLPILLICSMGIGCKKPEVNPPKEENSVKMDFDKLMTPIWDSDTMYGETVLMIEKDGVISGKLAFKPTKILSVLDSSWDKSYEVEKDYQLKSNNTLVLPQGSRIPYMKSTDFFASTKPNVSGMNDFPSNSSRIPDLMYTETPYIFERQITVIYEYDRANEFNLRVVEAYQPNKLPKLKAKLAEKKGLYLAVLGDSISEGANSSGTLNRPPYLPNYSGLFRQYVEHRFDVDIAYRNYSVGGQVSSYGLSRSYAVGASMPDVVIIAFGMNDGGCGKDNNVTPISVKTYSDNVTGMMRNIREYNPNCEFILVSPQMPNPLSGAFGIQSEYADALTILAKQDRGVISVNMYTLHAYLLDVGKSYQDMTTNNINHPNDFMMRLYAMNMISALFE